MTTKVLRRCAVWTLAAIGFVSVALTGGAVAAEATATQVWDEHTVIMTEHRYEPRSMVLKVGVPTHVRLENRGRVLHYFGSASLLRAIRFIKDKPVFTGNHLHIPSEQTVDLYFVPESAGEFGFECYVPIHVLNGMHGMVSIKD